MSKNSNEIPNTPPLSFDDLKDQPDYDWDVHLLMLTVAAKLGLDTPGLCWGITLTGLFAFLRGDEAMQGFIDSLVASGNMTINEMKEADELMQFALKSNLHDQLEAVEQREFLALMKTNPQLDKEKARKMVRDAIEKSEVITKLKQQTHINIQNHPFIKKYLDTMALLQNIKINFDLSKYADLVPEGTQFLGQTSMVKESAKITQSHKTQDPKQRELEEIVQHTSFSKPYTKADLLYSLNMLIQNCEKLNERIGFTFHIPNHNLTCAYDPRTKKWLVLDGKQHPVDKVMDVKEVRDLAWKGMEGQDEYVVLEAKVITTQGTHQQLNAQAMRFHSTLTEKEIAQLPQDTKNQWLYRAASNGEHELLLLLLNNGANINVTLQNNITPLWVAINNGHFEIAKTLIEKGADVNQANDKGISPLIKAVIKGPPTLVQALLAKGAEVNSHVEKKAIPLILAIHRGDIEVVKALLKSGANVNAVNDESLTSLTLAVAKGHSEIVKILIEAKPDMSLPANDISMLLHVAKLKGYIEIEKVLKATIVNSAENEVTPNNKLT